MDTLECIVQMVLVLGSVIALLLAWEIHKGNKALRDARLALSSMKQTDDGQTGPKESPTGASCEKPGTASDLTLDFWTALQVELRRYQRRDASVTAPGPPRLTSVCLQSLRAYFAPLLLLIWSLRYAARQLLRRLQGRSFTDAP